MEEEYKCSICGEIDINCNICEDCKKIICDNCENEMYEIQGNKCTNKKCSYNIVCDDCVKYNIWYVGYYSYLMCIDCRIKNIK